MRLKKPLFGCILITSSIALFCSRDSTSPFKISILTGSFGMRVHHFGGERSSLGRTQNCMRYPLRTTESVQTSEVIFPQAFRKKEILPPVGRSNLGTCFWPNLCMLRPCKTAWEPNWAPLWGIGPRSLASPRTLILTWISPRWPLRRILPGGTLEVLVALRPTVTLRPPYVGLVVVSVTFKRTLFLKT